MMLHPDTVAVTAGRPHGPGDPLNVPLTPASTYRAGGVVYGREGNPSWTALEEAVGALEGGHATAFASGLAATASVLDTLPVGAVVVAHRGPYHGVGEQLAERSHRGQIQLRSVDLCDLSAAAAAVPGADLVWAETPSNPMVDVTDVAGLANLTHRAGARLVVDSTFASPMLQQPLLLGADVVVHSGTKLIGGHSDLLLGLVLAGDRAWAERFEQHRHDNGAVPGALETFLALRGLRTLPVRLSRMQESAAVLADRLAGHPAVTRVRYPGRDDHPGHAVAAQQMSGFGSMLSFDTIGDAATADAVTDALRIVVHATSLGGVETLAERRARYPAESDRGTPPTLIRLSVGLEHPADLWADLAQALDGVLHNG
ncbi:MAG: PLP-dependent transferase [Actinomycetota bacterium]|nr:PLP-dependent transferase [Actinomycetota bacterium]